LSDLTQVQIEQRDNVVVARLTGELDISVAESTGRKIADAVSSSARGVVVDMSGLEFMDSSGVSMLFALV
jgi:anti-sigma B factor antagonist